MLRAIDTYQGTPTVHTALALAPLVFLRPGEVRKAEWAEFDLDGAVWTVPAARPSDPASAARRLSGFARLLVFPVRPVARRGPMRP